MQATFSARLKAGSRIVRPAGLLAALLLLVSHTAGSPDPGVSLQPFVNDHSSAGAVTLVAEGGQITNLGIVGFADLATQRPMPTNDLFWIASMPPRAAGHWPSAPGRE
jgi:hypothetical protein